LTGKPNFLKSKVLDKTSNPPHQANKTTNQKNTANISPFNRCLFFAFPHESIPIADMTAKQKAGIIKILLAIPVDRTGIFALKTHRL